MPRLSRASALAALRGLDQPDRFGVPGFTRARARTSDSCRERPSSGRPPLGSRRRPVSLDFGPARAFLPVLPAGAPRMRRACAAGAPRVRRECGPRFKSRRVRGPPRRTADPEVIFIAHRFRVVLFVSRICVHYSGIRATASGVAFGDLGKEGNWNPEP